jgi:hypothetical protein
VIKLGIISSFGLLFKDPGKFLGKIWFVAGISRVTKGSDVDLCTFKLSFDEKV